MPPVRSSGVPTPEVPRRARHGARARRAVALVLALAVLGGCALRAEPAAEPRSSEPDAWTAASAAARSSATEILEQRHLPALAFAVARSGRVLLAEGLGWADVERRVPATAETQFRIGSVSKLLTATAAARLYQEGQLDLDAPIGRYLPDLPTDKAGITSRQLAGHLAGIHHYTPGTFIGTRHYGDVTESLDRFLQDPLLSRPGDRYAYSSFGFNLLGAVVQAAARKEFRRVVADEVLLPLGMSHTSAEESPEPSPGRARPYSRDVNGSLVDAPMADLSDRWPSGGFLSSASDLALLGVGVLRRGYLESKAGEALFTSQRTSDGKATGVGLGWRIGQDPSGRRVLHHGGESLGGRALLVVYPDEGMAVALLTNLTNGPIAEDDAAKLAAPFLSPGERSAAGSP